MRKLRGTAILAAAACLCTVCCRKGSPGVADAEADAAVPVPSGERSWVPLPDVIVDAPLRVVAPASVYAAPNPASDVIAVVSEGAEVTHIGESRGFTLVAYVDPRAPARPRVGWVPSRLLGPAIAARPAPPSASVEIASDGGPEASTPGGVSMVVGAPACARGQALVIRPDMTSVCAMPCDTDATCGAGQSCTGSGTVIAPGGQITNRVHYCVPK